MLAKKSAAKLKNGLLWIFFAIYLSFSSVSISRLVLILRTN